MLTKEEIEAIVRDSEGDVMHLINEIASSQVFTDEQRTEIYRKMGLKTQSFIAHRCYFSFPQLGNVIIGKDTQINYAVEFDNGAEIRIGDRCDIAMHVKFITATHNIGPSHKRAGWGCIRKPIVVGDGCWIGAGAMILPGVTIAAGSVIGAGSIVAADCEGDAVYVGVAARKIKDLQ